MQRCKCGSNEFYALQVHIMPVTVDADNFFIDVLSDTGSVETPYGPYECTTCHTIYKTLDDLPENDDVYPESNDINEDADLFK